MEPVSHVIKVSLPRYLSGLPVPNSFLGFFRLSLRELLSLTPLGLIVAGTGYLSYRALGPTLAQYYGTKADPKPEKQPESETPKPRKPHINEFINKDSPKVVDTIEIEDIGEKKAFCRCWCSKKFPYCDGSHAAHNTETGDNVGPLIIKK